MNYWLLGLLIASNCGLLIYVIRAARLSHALEKARAKVKALKSAQRADEGRKRHPEMLAALKASPLTSMASFAVDRLPRQHALENHLPPLTCDLNLLKAVIEGPTSHDPKTPRSDMANHRLRLRNEFQGAPEICFVNALCIAYLRRRTPHTKHAQALFMRLWEEEGTFLTQHSQTRWLLSTLGTFMDHGQNAGQRMIGAAGITFGNTVKLYEWERVAHGLLPNSPYTEQQLTPDLEALPGAGRISIGRGDIARNTLAYLTDLSLRDPVAGPVLLALLLRIQEGTTVFTRLDNAKRALDAAEADGTLPRRHWSFGRHPDDKG